MVMKRVVDSLVLVCSMRTSVNCFATKSRMSVASFWLSPNCARMFSNIRLVPSPSFNSKLRSSSCMRCCSRTMPCVSCGVWRAHTTYARSAKIATRRARMSHSIRSIVAFRRLAILSASMGEGMDDPNKITRRAFVAGTAASALGAPAAAQAGIIDTILGRDNIEDLQDKMHGTNFYMDHTDGELNGNLQRLQLEIGDKMRSGGYDKFKKPGEREQAQKIDQGPIFREREAILAKFDPSLIPQLLVTYIQRGVIDKSLVKVYEQLGGDVEKVRKQGAAGVAREIMVSRIPTS